MVLPLGNSQGVITYAYRKLLAKPSCILIQGQKITCLISITYMPSLRHRVIFAINLPLPVADFCRSGETNPVTLRRRGWTIRFAAS
jgi:hypothetical protein